MRNVRLLHSPMVNTGRRVLVNAPRRLTAERSATPLSNAFRSV